MLPRTIALFGFLLSPSYTIASRTMTSCAATTPTLDLIVIGAGISGLTCADIAIAQGLHTVVLEARDRIGGRLLSFQGVDLGASWGWPPHEAEGTNLATRFHVDVLPQQLSGRSYQFHNGKMHDVGNVGGRMAPCGPDAVRFQGGYAVLAEKLAAQLQLHDEEEALDCRNKDEEKGTATGSLRLGAHVKSVVKSTDGSDLIHVTFTTNNVDTTLITKKVVVAMPPAVLAKAISFSPPLPRQQLAKMQQTSTWCGDWCKIVATFRTNWWRPQGVSGVVSTQELPVSIWWEGGKGEDEEVAAITGLGFGLEACQQVGAMLDNKDALKAFVVRHLGLALPGGPQKVSEELIDVGGKAWALDPWTYNGNATGRDYGHTLLKERTEWGVFFAGSETEPLNGHVEGAIVAGRRAAREVIESLS
jgi:monoamine oxidase